MSITVYTKPSCVQCNATYRALDAKGIKYTPHDLSEDPSALERVKALGYMQAPSSWSRSAESWSTTGRASVRTRSAIFTSPTSSRDTDFDRTPPLWVKELSRKAPS